MTIGVYSKGKFVSDSQITETGPNKEIIRKILDPGFTKIQKGIKVRKKGKPPIKKTVQFSGSVKAYSFLLEGLIHDRNPLKYEDKILTLCRGDETTPPISFQFVYRIDKEKYSWSFLVDKTFKIYETGLIPVDWNHIGMIGSGGGAISVQNSLREILKKDVNSRGIDDLYSLAEIAIGQDDYCGGNIMKCDDIKEFSAVYGESQLKAVNDLLGNVAVGCVAEAHINTESAIRILQDQGVELKVYESRFKQAQAQI
ncbi:hypothetical protein [Marinomonas sp.]|uniref:hypothetical protein n=1 Tax=Marinomonas sp. TaxID=1904862 RepID=UPI003BA94F87